jgi:hypothetical protein
MYKFVRSLNGRLDPFVERLVARLIGVALHGLTSWFVYKDMRLSIELFRSLYFG